MNRIFRGKGLRCTIVPAVAGVSFPQAAHSRLARRRFSSRPLSWPQAGHTKPSGQRLAARGRAQEASSGKRASKVARDIGRSYFQRLAISEHYTNKMPTTAGNSISRQTGPKGISPIWKYNSGGVHAHDESAQGLRVRDARSPPALLDVLNLEAGTRVDIGIEDGCLVIAPRPRPRYSLDELPAQCEANAALSAEDRAWLDTKPVGNELR